MRTLVQLLTALKADGHPDARAIKIHKNSNAVQASAGASFVAVNPGESDPIAITEAEKKLLLDNQATHDDTKIYGEPKVDG